MIDKYILVYLADILAHSDSATKHVQHLKHYSALGNKIYMPK